MDRNDRSHFIIPKESISKLPIEKTGGGQTYKRGDLAGHSISLKRNFEAISKSIIDQTDYKTIDSVIIAVKTPEDWNVKKEKSRLNDLGFQILEYSKINNNIATVNIDKKKWIDLESKITKYAETKGEGKTNLQAIEGFIKRPIEEYVKIDDISDESKINAMITFYNILTHREIKLLSDQVLHQLTKLGNEAKIIEYSDKDFCIACKANNSSLTLIAQSFSTVKSIVKDEPVFIEKASMGSARWNTVLSGTPLTSQTIAIVDDGIFPRNDLSKLIKVRCANQLIDAISPITTHGTFVASRAVFGDLDPKLLGISLTPTCFIADIPVFGIDKDGSHLSPKETDLIKALDDFVPKHYRNIKIYNLSLGFGCPTVKNSFSETAKRIDYLSEKYDVLFIVSAGNINTLLGSFPDQHFCSNNAKILSPSESLLCLCVGSIAKKSKSTSMSQSDEISAFSRIGPGLFGSVKPELVAHGGNISQNYTPDADIATLGFSTSNGIVESDVGTSFSAPIIANYAAQIFDFYPMFGTNMVKALLIHSAIAKTFPGVVKIPNHYGSGYGEPSIDICLQSANNSCVYLSEGVLTTTDYNFINFYVPEILQNGKQNFTVKITIVFSPQVNRNNDLEYSCGRVSSQMFKLQKGSYKAISATKPNLSDPYNTVVQYSNNFKTKIEPGEWAVRLRLFARNVDQATYKQKYAIVISLSDDLNHKDLRDEVIKETKNKYIKQVQERKNA